MGFPTVNVIFDDRQSEDYGRLLGEFVEQGVTLYRFWDAICDKDSVVSSINASHKMIISWAKVNKKPLVVIAEQDLHFTCLGSWDYFINNKPNDFDVYIGGSYLIDNRIDYKAPITKVPEWIGNHLIIVHEKYYDRFLSVKDNLHIDTAQSGLGDFYLCYPMPALQRSGWSANNRTICNYNSALREEDIWKG